MPLSVKPKGMGIVNSGTYLRTHHPYSDKGIKMAQERSGRAFNLRRELARNDRTIKRLRDKREQGRVFYT